MLHVLWGAEDLDQLEILRFALRHDFLPYEDDAGGQLLPTELLKALSETLDADGGNVSINDYNENVLVVRGYYCKNANTLPFAEAKDKIVSIGRNPQKRPLSSSYRCFDGGTNILVPRTDTENNNLTSLALENLEPANGVSALAVLLTLHGRNLGVLHLDKGPKAETPFGPEDQVYVESVCELLPSIIYNSILTQGIKDIKSLVARHHGKPNRDLYHNICKSLSGLLLVPGVFIYQQHENIPNLFELDGCSQGVTAQVNREPPQRFRITDEEILRQVFADELDSRGQTESLNFEAFEPQFGAFFPKGRTLIKPLVDPQFKGFMIIVDSKELRPFEVYVRLIEFLGDFIALTLSSLAQFERHKQETYETAAHEFVRNINEIANSQKRLVDCARSLDAVIRVTRGLAFEDDLRRISHRFQTQTRNLRDRLESAAATLHALIRTPESADRLFVDDPYRSNPLIRDAKRRHSAYSNAVLRKSFDLREVIEDTLNNYTKRMNQKRVKWLRAYHDMPRSVFAEKKNFEIVFGNLVDNAVKYSRKNADIRLEVDSTELFVELRITNTGPHIDALGEEMTDIFARGYRGVEAARLAGGTGFGLWEARLVARLLGGNPLRLKFSEPLERVGDVQWARICFEFVLPVDPV